MVLQKSISLLCAGLFLLITAYPLYAAETNTTHIFYVNNEIGSDLYNGLSPEYVKEISGKGPFASIQKAFSSVSASDHISVANTGKPYPGGNSLTRTGGTAERPMVIDGHGAVISGLAIVLAKDWKHLKNNVFETDFWPMSNYLKGYNEINHWIGSPQIWWLNGKPAPNCKNEEELEKTELGFFWNKKTKKLWVHLPDGRTINEFEIKIPVHGTAIDINCDFVVVNNFRSMFSWNDGFDVHGSGKNIVFKNCIATDNCGQGFSCHGTSSALYEDCLAERCASSGSCDVNFCNTTYRRCVFVNNTFEAGIYITEQSLHVYENCLVMGNMPFEQLWQTGNSKMNFINCVITGAKDNQSGILKLQNGSAFFDQCTITDAPFVCNMSADLCGSLDIKNSIIGRCDKPFFTISQSSRRAGRIWLENNLYFDSPGIMYQDKLYQRNNWDEYQKMSGLDKGSAWMDPALEGPLRLNIPEKSPIRTMGKLYGSPRRIGAELPNSVWELYFKTRNQYPLPDGTFQNEPYSRSMK